MVSTSNHPPASAYHVRAWSLLYGTVLTTGIALAMLVVVGQTKQFAGLDSRLFLRAPDAGNPVFEGLLSTGLYAALCYGLYRVAMSKKKHA